VIALHGRYIGPQTSVHEHSMDDISLQNHFSV